MGFTGRAGWVRAAAESAARDRICADESRQRETREVVKPVASGHDRAYESSRGWEQAAEFLLGLNSADNLQAKHHTFSPCPWESCVI